MKKLICMKAVQKCKFANNTIGEYVDFVNVQLSTLAGMVT